MRTESHVTARRRRAPGARLRRLSAIPGSGVMLAALTAVAAAQGDHDHASRQQPPAAAAEAAALELPRIEVRGAPPPGVAAISGEEAFAAALVSANAADVLNNAPGAARWGGGGVSGLPAINGFAADRVQISLNGMLFGIFCPNEMNPPLSFVNPAMVAAATVHYGTAPVSLGGDYTGARVEVEAGAPVFGSGPGVKVSGRVSGGFRSNGDGRGVDADLSAATADASVRYVGGWSRARDYRDGAGRKVKSTLFEAQNHAITVARKFDSHLFAFQLGGQYIPDQAYPNQYMDMVSNRSLFGNARYAGDFDWGALEARAFASRVRHSMGFIAPDKNGAMPMDTRASDMGFAVKATWRAAAADTLRAGAELYRYRLDDWWNPVPGTMMGPDVFIAINNGRRARLGTFLEWERRLDSRWTLLAGLRNDTVWTGAGPVRGYNAMMYGADAAAFNSRSRARADVNLDGQAALRFQPDAVSTYELAFARKTRSPNLYERYAWSTGAMAMRMTGWFGDGNGYVGDPDLKPETAHTASFTAVWRDAAGRWRLRATPWFSHVVDYIDADRCAAAGCLAARRDNLTARNGFVYLRFANHDARLYGVNVDGQATLWDDAVWGRGVLRGQLSLTRGRRTDGVNLYQIMPVNAVIALDHAIGGWTASAELQLVGAKHLVSQVRNEVKTSAHALVNLRAGYKWEMLRFEAAVENLFDARYYKPLGGADLVNSRAYSPTGAAMWGLPVAGMGRTFSARLSVEF